MKKSINSIMLHLYECRYQFVICCLAGFSSIIRLPPVSSFILVNQCLCHNLGYKQKIIQLIRRNQVYFSSSNVSTDTTVIVKD